MKNPLFKRLPREFAGEFGKYFVIFVFMAATIGLISGFLVADNSLIESYNESFEKYHIEDGNFELQSEADTELLAAIEAEGVSVYENFYVEKSLVRDGEIKATIRIFKDRSKVNQVCLMKGEMPVGDNEIALDRLFAKNNGIDVGDVILVEGRELKVSGYVALSDYSTMFENNNDIMFDATMFGVAIMTDTGYEGYTDGLVHYGYSWTYNTAPKSEAEEIKQSEQFLYALNSKAQIVNYIPRYSNQAINFTGDDMGGDKSMMIVLLYILIVIMAFVFAVTTSNTITKEASVIGTLRASGYTRGELLRHYIALPVITTLTAAIVGNILGYTVLKNVMAGLYFNSYSLTTYKTLWNAEAFVLTTIVPIVLMIIINLAVIYSKLKLSPLRFLRNDLSKSKKKKAVRLPHFKFLSRYRLRVIIQNIPNYITLFIGIVFANVLLIFGMIMSPLLHHFADQSVESMIADYQYILKTPIDTETAGAEKYCVISLETTSKRFKVEEITVYGIEQDSQYIDVNIEKNEVWVSILYADKYDLHKGDSVTLKNEYDGATFTFKIKGIYDYPASMSVFMNRQYFNELFAKDAEYFNGYFTDQELSDVDERYVMSVIDENDMTKISRQMDKSMGGMMDIVKLVSLVLFALLIYLLTKLIIEKNAISISMIKILGYQNGEIGRIYLLSTSIVVIISTVCSLAVATLIIKLLYKAILSSMSGWILFWIDWSTYPVMFAMGVGIYFIVLVMQFIKIRRIPMSDALKNIE